ncbi:ABC transporter permease subunit [Alkalimonas collagenimarina]|uniref:ABC transporter permease subunit n=1 Tax=Alkalimonas collagenimarina TaxID=400390 RepID=A0ABT9GWN3_9GAMM|nr:ABC transporter permease subunit [Alkalimonas collagenimarina]MDP4535476.1 ABC transporter permease subunit [Alkalimonas collagenimarina]
MPHPKQTLQHCGLYASFELRRLLLTRRGLMTLAATTVIWFFLLRYAIAPASDIIVAEGFQQVFSDMFGSTGLSQLFAWPAPELAIYWILSLLLLPMLCLFFTANQLCSDLQRGTLRLLALRSSRLSIVLGRFSGQMLVQCCLILLSLVATLALATWREGSLTLPMLNAAAVIAVNLLLVLLPFTALMSCFSAMVRSSRLAVSLAIVSLGLLVALLSWFIVYFPDFLFLLGYLPGVQVMQLLPLQGWQTLQHAVLPLVQTVVLLGLASLLLTRRAL